MATRSCLVTTMDNMFNPFTENDKWLSYDSEMQYHTNEWLSIFSKASSNLEEDEYNDAYEEAVEMLLEINPSGMHYKVYEDEADTLIPLAYETYKKSFGIA